MTARIHTTGKSQQNDNNSKKVIATVASNRLQQQQHLYIDDTSSSPCTSPSPSPKLNEGRRVSLLNFFFSL